MVYVSIVSNTLFEFLPIEFPDCEGQVAIVTGGNKGIGLETVKGLCKAHVTVIMGMLSVDLSEKKENCNCTQ